MKLKGLLVILAIVLAGCWTRAALAADSAMPAKAPTSAGAATAAAGSAQPAKKARRSSATEGIQIVPVKIYAKDNAPTAPKLEELPEKESVSQYGFTWTFEKPARVGQFITGDYYVVGPVTIKMIDPKPLFGPEVPEDQVLTYEKKSTPGGQFARNGSLLNPPPKQEVSFDSGIKNYYRPALFAHLPISMKPGDSLVSSIGIKKGETVHTPLYGSDAVRSDNDKTRPLVAEAILTCLAEPQPADAFRPAYCDRGQKIYLSRNLKRELLPKLDKVPTADAAALAKSWRSFQRPWFNTCFFTYDQACENMPGYAQQIAEADSDAGCLLCLDLKPEEKEPLLIGVVQAGIDFYGTIRAGHPGWEGFGGHGSGRKFPIVFAGVLLGDDEMANINKTLPKAKFGEDEQTAYGDSWTGARVVFTGHSGISVVTGLSKEGQQGHIGFGPFEHKPVALWTYGNFVSNGYRCANTTRAWVGQALVMHLLKAEKTWNHDAFFDYVDRWMAEGPLNDAFVKEAAKYCPFTGHGAETSRWSKFGGVAEGPVVREMYAKYRATCAWPMDGWKQKHDDSYYLNAVKDMDQKIEAEKKKLSGKELRNLMTKQELKDAGMLTPDILN